MPRSATSTDALRRSLDSSVAVARTVAVLGCAGTIAAVAAAAWAATLLVVRLLPLAGGSTHSDAWPLVAAAAAAAGAAWPAIRTAAAAWPSRLMIAVAAERAHPQLGERISRAVEFLDEVASAAATDRGSAALKALAVEQAAEAAAGIGRLPVPALRGQLRLAAAGGAAIALVAALTLATSPSRTTDRGGGETATTAATPAASRSTPEATLQIWRKLEAIRGQLAGGRPPTHAALATAIAAVAAESERALEAAGGESAGVLSVFAAALPQLERDLAARPADDAAALAGVRRSLDELSSLARAAVRIADAAAFERSLAAVLSEWFALEPGELPADLPAPVRGGLDRAANLEDECLQGINADRKTLLVATQRQPVEAKLIASAANPLAGFDGPPFIRSANDIRDNRLAIAADSARRAADLLEGSAKLLGMTGTGASATPIPPAARTAAPDPTSNPSAADIARGLLDRIHDDVTSAAESGNEPAVNAAAAAGRGAGADGSATTTSPQAGTVTGPPTAAELPAGADEIARAWLLLQERSFPQRPQGGDLLAFPSHRQAIDAYYRLLLESSRGRKQPSSQP